MLSEQEVFGVCVVAQNVYSLPMKTVLLRRGLSRGLFLTLTSFAIGFGTATHADQVEMLNGDRYSGKVVALESNTVVLHSEVLGKVRIRRDHVASLSFGARQPQATAQTVNTSGVPKAPPVPVVSPGSGPNPPLDLQSSLSHQITANPHLVREIQSQVLAGAGPKALQKYDSLVSGLSSGTLNVADLRKEAASVATQLRQLRGHGDDDSAAIFDEYLELLDAFVDETKTATPPAKPASTANPVSATSAKPGTVVEPAQ